MWKSKLLEAEMCLSMITVVLVGMVAACMVVLLVAVVVVMAVPRRRRPLEQLGKVCLSWAQLLKVGLQSKDGKRKINAMSWTLRFRGLSKSDFMDCLEANL